MPSFNPFSSLKSKHALALFDIRLESDFLVFRGNEHESSGQLLKGVVLVCVPAPTKIEDIQLRLIGTQRFSWTDAKATAAGISTQRVDRTANILDHKWEPFFGTAGKSTVLEKGNYEFPFELLLPGDTAESVEGMTEAGVMYKLKATIGRGKWAYDFHTYRRVRVIRTLESSALEFLHAMSVENIWPNKVEYSIVIPQKAIVFGSAVPLETRFTPLLKGLEIGDISIKLMEVHDVVLKGVLGHTVREYRREKLVAMWKRPVTREEHWQEMIEDTGQEGWVLNTMLDLPKKLGTCIQDVNVLNIRVRHKLKMVVSLKNPDGHVSELRATLPISIFISPNIPFDDEGNVMRPEQVTGTSEMANGIAPPGYGEHVLDQLYDGVNASGAQTPAPQSGANSPMYGNSRSTSNDNLAGMDTNLLIPPAALSSRLQNVSRDSSPGRSPAPSVAPSSGATTPYPQRATDTDTPNTTPPTSAPLSRHHSGSSLRTAAEHVELCKVPSYATAMKITRVAPLSLSEGGRLPDYWTATSAPPSPNPATAPTVNPLSLVTSSA